MLKKQSKKLAIMLVLSMIASLFVGVGTASAANGVAVSIDRVYSEESEAGPQKIGTLSIKEDSDYTNAFKDDDTFLINLPSNLKWNAKAYGTHEGEVATKNASGDTLYVTLDGKLEVKISGNYTMTATVRSQSPSAKDIYSIPLYVNFDGVEEGYAYATIDGMDSPVPSGDYAIANVLSGGSSATATDTFTAGPDTADKTFVFRLTETTVGTFAKSAVDNDSVTLTLPKKIDFTKIEVTGLGGASGSAVLKPSSDKDNHNKITFKMGDDLDNKGIDFAPAGTNARSILEFKATVDIDNDAKIGAVNLDIDGEGKVDSATIKVGTVADYGVALSAEDAKTVLAGRVCQEVGKIVIYENVADAFNYGRNIKIELPDGVQFAGSYSDNDFKATKGAAYGDISSIKSDEESLSFRVDKIGSSPARVKIEVPMKSLNIASDFVGDIVATVSGRAGVEGEVVIGTVVAPIEVAVANVADVKIGYQAQALADITITEVETGALLEDGDVLVELPTGVAFQDKEVDVEVTEGNLEIKSVKVNAPTSKNNGYVKFTVDSASSASQPSTVTISGLYLDVDRTVAEGPIKAIVKGNAIAISDEAYVKLDEDPFKSEYDTKYGYTKTEKDDKGNVTTTMLTKYLFDNDGEYGRFVIANCVTPGVGETTANAVGATSTFVIGSTAAIIAGSDSVMPVAPYISNSRTLLPVRYVAYACGVPEANVIWNPDNQTVTLLNNNGTVVQLTIGSTTMQVNGVAVIMDVAPQITNGYTFLPARYVANAFGYDASWEAATQTVTISPIQ